MSGVSIIKIKPEDDDIRLNRWFLREYPALSLSRLQKLLRTKQIKVDGKRAETSTRLKMGQEVRIPPLDNEKAQPDSKQITPKDIDYMKSLVIYKDKDIIVLNKPSGLAVQGGTNTTRHIDGMLEALKYENSEKPKLVHRIDKETSGILLLARNRKIAEVLTKAFREHTIQKTYLAILRGCPDKLAGEINKPLEKVGEKMAVTPAGKKAITLYKVLDKGAVWEVVFFREGFSTEYCLTLVGGIFWEKYFFCSGILFALHTSPTATRFKIKKRNLKSQ